MLAEAAALTDTNGVAGGPEFVESRQRVGVRPLVGAGGREEHQQLSPRPFELLLP